MKLGIVSTGRVIDMFWEAYPDLKGVQVSAICCRPQSVERANYFAAKYNIPAVYTNYQQFLQQGDFDFVYNGATNSVHYSQTKQALAAGRNVILEKPFTVTAAETKELCQLAQQKGVWLFEAITTIHLPAFSFLRQHLEQIGPVRGVQMNFSAYSSRYTAYLDRQMTVSFDPAHAGGALYDMNVYNLHLLLGLLGAPNKVKYLPNRGWNGIDTSGLALLQYNGFSAALLAAKDSAGVNGMSIQGENGRLVVDGDPNACHTVYAVIDGQRIEGPTTSRHRMTYEFEAFDAMWQQNDRAGMQALLEHTTMVMEHLEALHRSADDE